MLTFLLYIGRCCAVNKEQAEISGTQVYPSGVVGPKEVFMEELGIEAKRLNKNIETVVQ